MPEFIAGGRMVSKKKRRVNICPECGSGDIIPILYGMPALSARKREEEGKLYLGGCCITEDDPKWHCKKCATQFGKVKWKHGNSE